MRWAYSVLDHQMHLLVSGDFPWGVLKTPCGAVDTVPAVPGCGGLMNPIRWWADHSAHSWRGTALLMKEIWSHHAGERHCE
jgi:hypothetical protein